jgi:hypothetical protein
MQRGDLTVLTSCLLHGVNPLDYLKGLFTRLPAPRIIQIKEFTPAAWGQVANDN